MKHSSTWFALILIASALLLSAGRNISAASHNPREKKHQEPANEAAQTAKPLEPEPSVPLRDFEAAQSALLDALRALHAEQEARSKDQHPSYEPIYAPSVLIQFALLIVGFFYTLYARRQWAAIKTQARIANDALIENRKAADAAKQSADAAAQQIRFITRPKIEVYADTLITQDTTVSAYYTVVNNGETPARVMLQRMSLWRKYTGVAWPSEMPSGDTVNDILLPIDFEARDRRSSQLTLKLSFDAGLHPATDWRHFMSDGLFVCLSGHFLYTDESGTKHETFFCRAWSRVLQKFIVPESMPTTYNRQT